MIVLGDSKATLFEGSIGCQGKVMATNFDNVDVDVWIETNSHLATNTIRGYDASEITVEDNLTFEGNLTVMGNTIFTGTVSGIPIGGATQI